MPINENYPRVLGVALAPNSHAGQVYQEQGREAAEKLVRKTLDAAYRLERGEPYAIPNQK